MGGIEVVVDIGVLNKAKTTHTPAGFKRLFGTTKAACPNAGAIGLGVNGGEVGIFGVDGVVDCERGDLGIEFSAAGCFPKAAHGFGDGFLYFNISDLLLDGDRSELAHGQALNDGVSEIVDVGLSRETASSGDVFG